MNCRIASRWPAFALLVAGMGGVFPATARAEVPPLPSVAPIPDQGESHAFLAAAHQMKPLDLAARGYVEEEYRVGGRARVFDWPDSTGALPVVLGEGAYVTRILVRRPKDAARFNGTVIVEPFNPSTPVDLPIMWAQSHEHFISGGYAWVGISIKPNTIKTLQRFDAARYGDLALPNPSAAPRCAEGAINPSSQPTTTADETGLAWDIISQVGALLKATGRENPLKGGVQRLYLTGQSQTAGYARTWATLFGRTVKGANGRPLYDAYLYSGSPPWQVPLHQCRKDLPPGDARLITPAVGVPVIELFAQGDIGTNIETRRPDADSKADRFRRYEVAGAPHVDSWEELSFASKADMLRATGDSVASQDNCRPADVAPSDFPNRHAFNAAWQNLDLWVRRGIAPPRAPLLSLKPRAPGQPFDPASAFVEDASGNAMGGVRTPAIDVPTARWVGAKTGAFRCLFEGYKIPFDDAKLRSLYPDHAAYLAQVKRSAAALERERWLTAADAREIVQEAEREPARVYSEATLATHTIYRPAKLTGRYPVVLWGNGSCVNSSFHYREFLAQIASQGFIVLAIGPYRDSAPPRQQRPENPAEWPPFETRSSQMLDALDWITAENARRDSPFYGKVDSNKVAAMGHSCGGLQTIKVSTDPRITTAVVLNSGMITDDDQYMIRHDVKRSILSQMHAPIAYFIGGEKDIAYANAETDWQELQRLRIPAINANMDVGHGATYDQPNGGPFASGPLAWLQWRLKGDERARAQFVGERCGFCDGKAWRLRRHLIE